MKGIFSLQWPIKALKERIKGPNGHLSNSDAGKVRVIDEDQYGIQFNVDKSMCSNVEEWKAWLSQNNVTVYAELNEPIITELTAEQVSEFCKLHTYDGSTNINTDDICDICVEYISNTKKYIDSLFNHGCENYNEI